LVNGVQILQEIASYLPDKDLSELSSVCTTFARQILPAESYIWRKRFETLYELDPSHTPFEIKNKYRARALALSYPISFQFGETEKETIWLKLLIMMLLETYISKKPDDSSKNLTRIAEAMEKSDFLHRPRSGFMNRKAAPPSEYFYALQLVR
jgi:hypothetical protein